MAETGKLKKIIDKNINMVMKENNEMERVETIKINKQEVKKRKKNDK